MAANSDAAPAPDAFRRAVEDMMSAPWRSELHVEELPAPQRIAPYSAAITADVVANGDEVGSGRFVLLHDPAGNAAWQGTFRCVTFARADLDPEMVDIVGRLGIKVYYGDASRIDLLKAAGCERAKLFVLANTLETQVIVFSTTQKMGAFRQVQQRHSASTRVCVFAVRTQKPISKTA